MALISQSEVEAKLGRSLSSSEATAFAVVNLANQRYVERLIGSNLETQEEATRYYDGGVFNLEIDPCTNITSVKYVDEDSNVIETFDSSDYIKKPINRTLKTMIERRYARFYKGKGNIAVVAKFSVAGDTDVIAIIKDALINAVAAIIDNKENVDRISIEGYSVSYSNPPVKKAIESIKFLFPEII